jgi:hypothetical protein
MEGLEALATPESMARLDEALKDVPAADGPVIEGGGEVDSAQRQPVAAADPTKTDPDSSKTVEGTQATAEAAKADQPAKGAADTQTDPKNGQQAKPGEKAATEFSKDQQRRDTSWKALNAEKEKFRAEQETLRQEREQWQRQREQEAVKSARGRYTPEQYEQAAGNMAEQARTLDLQAKGLEAEAQKLEDEGKYKEAEKARAQAQDLKEDAAYQRKSAVNAKAQAEHVRKNPDPTLQAVQQRNQQAMQHFTLEAAKKWPEFAKEGGDFQKKVVGELQAARKLGIDVNESPALMYHAVRLVAAETAAARVPTLEQELGEAKAKVKELELLTAPGGGQDSARRGETSAPKFDEMSADQQLAALSQAAPQFLGR